MTTLPTYYLWTDFETTGLDPDLDYLLEAAWVLTDADLRAVTTPTTHLVLPEHVAHRTPDGLTGWVEQVRARSHPTVRDMHDESGLWRDLKDADGHYTPAAVDIEVDMWIRDTLDDCGHPGAEVALAGSGVGHFDLPYIKANLPRIESALTYWVLDMGVARRYLRDVVRLPLPDLVTTQHGAHRAHNDVMRSLEEARQYRDHLREWITATPTVEITNDRGPDDLASA